MESKNKIFVRERLAGKSVEEAAQIAGITEQELLSAQRSEAGAKGGASKKRVEIQEQNRRLRGRKVEEQLAEIRAEENIPVDGWDRSITKFHWHELMHWAEQVLLGIGYDRKYPPSGDEFFDVYEIQHKQPHELREYFDTYPEYACLSMIDWCRSNHLTDGLRKLAIWTFEEFIDWKSKEVNNQFVHDQDLQTIKRALLDLQQDKDLYDPPSEPEQSSPEPDPRQHPAYIRDSQAQLERVSFFTQTAESNRQAEEARRIEAEIHQKHLEAQRVIDQERLRSLPSDAIRYLHG